jgi:hypothetical protein
MEHDVLLKLSSVKIKQNKQLNRHPLLHIIMNVFPESLLQTRYSHKQILSCDFQKHLSKHKHSLKAIISATLIPKLEKP